MNTSLYLTPFAKSSDLKFEVGGVTYQWKDWPVRLSFCVAGAQIILRDEKSDDLANFGLWVDGVKIGVYNNPRGIKPPKLQAVVSQAIKALAAHSSRITAEFYNAEKKPDFGGML